MSELAKLIAAVPPEGVEIAVRFKLSVTGAAYDFGEKFGANAQAAVVLLRHVADAGFMPALSFHPGTQCHAAQAWGSYIRTAAQIADAAGVVIVRVNVGGGFPSHRTVGSAPDLAMIFATIDQVATEAFGDARPVLVCEPGRGLCADAFCVATRVKAVRDGVHVFLNDGVYGTLTEMPQIGVIDRVEVIAASGLVRKGAPLPRVVFGPTCDSLDRLPGQVMLPDDLAEGDFVIFHGMGAYSTVTNTRFNGFGALSVETVLHLTA
jgi:ornithine decarboxylase